MKKLLSFLAVLLAPLSVFANPACAVCTVAIGASLSIAEAFGVDNCVVGAWSGAFLLMLGYWTIRFCDKKGWNFPGRDPLILILSVAMIGFMYMGRLTYTPNVIGFLYIDSFLFANILGALALIIGNALYQWMKAKNGGHAHFPFEKVVIPVVLILLVSLMFHFFPICNCGGELMPL
ncbi:MAG: hypothetical protein LBU87_01910 [Lactobacillales bacterium]|jgi:hypothetical protein|nr:hypothetical protein [Lactobacillales bacterium]